MLSVDTQEVQSQLSVLLAAVEERGERIRIYRNGKPIAELGPVPTTTRDPLKPHPELSQVLFHEDPSLPPTEEEWPEEFR